MSDHGCRLYVGNIDFRMTKEDIEDFFSQKGEVVDVFLPKAEESEKGKTPPHRGYVFVQMSTSEEATDAISEFHGEKDPHGRELIVRVADLRK